VAGTIIADVIQSDQSYPSSINIASPLIVSNTINMSNGSLTGNVNFDSGTLFVDTVNDRVGVGTTNPTDGIHVALPTDVKIVAESTSNTWAGFSLKSNTGYGSWNMQTGPGASGAFRIYDVGNSREPFRINTSGHVLIPYQPAFWVRTITTTQEGTDYIIGNNIVTNIGGHFSSSTKRFTAPVAGTYMLSVRVTSESNELHWAVIRKNGSQITDYALHYRQFDTGSVTIVITLAQGDYVTGTSRYGGAGIYGADFCGYLIG
jgi:hypothetical protein